MTVRFRVLPLIGLAVALALPGAPARAQYGYGWGRFGGWGASTAQGDMARGLGSLAAGAGQYNQQTAVANSINANTVMRHNEYMYQSQQIQNKRYYEQQARKIDRTNTAAAATADRLRNQPDPGDIERGDALNVLLDDLTAPGMTGSSGLRFADSEIDASVVRDIPFRNAVEAVTICIDQLVDKEKFPALLQSEALAAERDAFIKAAREAARQAREENEVSPAAAKAVQATGQALYAKAKSPKIRATPDERSEALNYLKGMAAFARMLENPDTVEALKELKKVEKTRVANLIAFMHTYNLRFGPAETPQQRNAYQVLYPILKADRDRVTASVRPQVGATPPPPNPKAGPTDLFGDVEEKDLNLPPSSQ